MFYADKTDDEVRTVKAEYEHAARHLYNVCIALYGEVMPGTQERIVLEGINASAAECDMRLTLSGTEHHVDALAHIVRNTDDGVGDEDAIDRLREIAGNRKLTAEDRQHAADVLKTHRGIEATTPESARAAYERTYGKPDSQQMACVMADATVTAVNASSSLQASLAESKARRGR